MLGLFEGSNNITSHPYAYEQKVDAKSSTYVLYECFTYDIISEFNVTHEVSE